MKFFNCAKARYTQKDLADDCIESDVRDVQAKINSILNASSRPTENPLFQISQNLKSTKMD